MSQWFSSMCPWFSSCSWIVQWLSSIVIYCSIVFIEFSLVFIDFYTQSWLVNGLMAFGLAQYSDHRLVHSDHNHGIVDVWASPPITRGQTRVKGQAHSEKGFFPKLLSISSGDFGDIIPDIMGFSKPICAMVTRWDLNMGYVHPTTMGFPWIPMGRKNTPGT